MTLPPVALFFLAVLGIGQLVAAVVAVMTYLRMTQLEETTNSKMDQLLDLTARSSHKAGRKEAEDEADAADKKAALARRPGSTAAGEPDSQ